MPHEGLQSDDLDGVTLTFKMDRRGERRKRGVGVCVPGWENVKHFEMVGTTRHRACLRLDGGDRELEGEKGFNVVRGMVGRRGVLPDKSFQRQWPTRTFPFKI